MFSKVNENSYIEKFENGEIWEVSENGVKNSLLAYDLNNFYKPFKVKVSEFNPDDNISETGLFFKDKIIKITKGDESNKKKEFFNNEASVVIILNNRINFKTSSSLKLDTIVFNPCVVPFGWITKDTGVTVKTPIDTSTYYTKEVLYFIDETEDDPEHKLCYDDIFEESGAEGFIIEEVKETGKFNFRIIESIEDFISYFLFHDPNKPPFELTLKHKTMDFNDFTLLEPNIVYKLVRDENGNPHSVESYVPFSKNN